VVISKPAGYLCGERNQHRVSIKDDEWGREPPENLKQGGKPLPKQKKEAVKGEESRHSCRALGKKKQKKKG